MRVDGNYANSGWVFTLFIVQVYQNIFTNFKIKMNTKDAIDFMLILKTQCAFWKKNEFAGSVNPVYDSNIYQNTETIKFAQNSINLLQICLRVCSYNHCFNTTHRLQTKAAIALFK